MGKKFQYVSLNRVLSKIYRDLGIEDISETDVVEWAGEALEGIGAVGIQEEALAFMEIKNYEAQLPNGLTTIIQVARDYDYSEPTCKKTCPADIVANDDEITERPRTNPSVGPNSCGVVTQYAGNTDGYPVPLDCNGTPITGYDVAYYRPYFDLQYEYFGWCQHDYYRRRYRPIRLANHSFFNSLVCLEDNELYQKDGQDEYTIVHDRIRTSFQTGFIAIAYNRHKVDAETGYPMIPDDYSVITAITYYITWKYMARMWYMGKDGYERKMREAEAQWQWYCTQAANMAFKPYGVDEHQNLMEQHYRMIPDRESYYGFFGKLGRRDNTTWKNADGRNDKFRIRGI